MKVLTITLLLLGMQVAHAASTSDKLSVHVVYQASSEPLTTEKVWGLDPLENNPHRQRWLLDRKVDLVGLRPVENPGAHRGSGTGWFPTESA